ncbi:MAG: homocysteine S-methyltransferase family protein [Aquiluna sp.]
MSRFIERLNESEPLLMAGGYLFEAERRGYLTAGEFVPKITLDHPEVLEQITRDFLRVGSDIALAFTYNGHREKMRITNQEHLLEPLNRAAMRIASKVAKEQSNEQKREIFVAGNISNSNIYIEGDSDSHEQVRSMYREMIAWAKEEGAELIVAETMYFLGEAMIALEEAKAAELPVILNVAVFDTGALRDGYSPGEACKILAENGATVVGTNCFQGPRTIRPIIDEIRSNIGAHFMSAMPSTYRTTDEHTSLFNLPDLGNTAKLPSGRTFPDALEAQNSNRYETAEFGMYAHNLGAKVIGLCCGASVIHHRSLAEALGRETALTRYSPDMSKHFLFGDDSGLNSETKRFGADA